MFRERLFKLSERGQETSSLVYVALVLFPWKGGSSKWAGVEVYTEESK